MPSLFAYLGLVMGVIFIAFGITCILKPESSVISPDTPNYLMYNGLIGLVLISYGAFRLWQSYRLIKRSKADQHNG